MLPKKIKGSKKWLRQLIMINFRSIFFFLQEFDWSYTKMVYIQLDNSWIKSWKDLAYDFIKQYLYNLDIMPIPIGIQNM